MMYNQKKRKHMIICTYVYLNILHTTYDSNQAHTSSTTIRFSGLMFAKQRTHLPRSPAFASRPRPTVLEFS